MIRLEHTTGNAVQAAITAERRRLGALASGMVMTLLVLVEEADQADATAAAALAAREHPMRVLVLVPRLSRSAPRLDAEISVGGEDGPGEIAVLRLRGELAHHAGSVAIPLLLTDTPVVAWWPSEAPKVPFEDPIGMHAQRRITSSLNVTRQLATLHQLGECYHPGDTDLAWTAISGWRSLLATALDQPHGTVVGVEVSGKRSHASSHLLAGWLHSRLRAPANVIAGRGPGITAVRLFTDDGDIVINRPDGATARLTRPGLPPATIALPRRSHGDLLAEELRWLDPDEVYGETLRAIDAVGDGRLDLGDRSGAAPAPAEGGTP